MKSVLPVLAAALFVPVALGGCVVVDSQGHIVREEKRFAVSGIPDLKLTTFDGAIEIAMEGRPAGNQAEPWAVLG